MANNAFGIDLGTNNIKIYNRNDDNIMIEKNMIAIENKNTLFAYGNSAFEMYEKAPSNIHISYPLSNGVIADIKNMETLVKYFIGDLQKGNTKPSDFFIAVPTDVTEVEKRAFYDLVKGANVKAKKIMVVEKAVADGLGLDIDVKNSQGVLVVNVGYETTEISILSLGGIVLSRLIKVGGMKFDDAIRAAVRREFSLIIGGKTAENVKIALKELEEEGKGAIVYGRDIVTGLPVEREIPTKMVDESLEEHFNTIIDNVKVILERTPPELAADVSSTGVLLTGGIRPSAEVSSLIEGWTGAPLPVLLTDQHTSKAFMSLQEIYGLIEPTDTRKINTVLGLYDHYVNGKEISARLNMTKPGRMTPMMFELNLIERAKANKMRIVLAEGEEPRILQATDILLRREVADIILLGNEDKINKLARELHLDISKATIIDPATSPKFEDYAATYAELRKAKGVTIERARDVMSDATYYATMMVKKDDADGMVSGAVNTTAHTIRPAFEFIKTKPGYSVVSSVFLMCLKDRVLVFGDCAVNPNPTSQQLAEIAVASADTAKVFGIDPRVAMLSYSTGTSGKGADVDVVVEATALAKEKAPELSLEGPLQYDAAIDPTVAKTKLPNSKVAGKATVFIFPDLNTGNNTYKAVQRAAEAVAIGPVLQGLNKPVNDLSRGCTVPDIVNTVAITAIQAAAEKQK
mgnify:CR=1 FL=1